MISPGSPAIFSTLILSSAATRYCLPPVLMTANIFFLVFVSALGNPARLLVQSVCLRFWRQAAETQASGPRPAPRDAYDDARRDCQGSAAAEGFLLTNQGIGL